jgi:hypothetical protein
VLTLLFLELGAVIQLNLDAFGFKWDLSKNESLLIANTKPPFPTLVQAMSSRFEPRRTQEGTDLQPENCRKAQLGIPHAAGDWGLLKPTLA